MTTDTDLLLALWHEVGHGADLAATVKAISARLAAALPHARLELIRCDAAARRFETAADTASLPGRHWQVTPAAFKALSGERARSPVLHLADPSSRPAALAALSAPAGKALLVGLLHDGGPLLGLAVLTSDPGGFQASHMQALAALLEPLTAVLAHDVRLHDLERRRALAEQERQLLLARLGRDAAADTIVGAERGLHTVMQRVAQVARSDSSVLLLGETGSGKEVVARAIHERSRRAGGPFVRVNCGALAPELVDSELFGHEKGSFTGAIGQRRGWFERADGGTRCACCACCRTAACSASAANRRCRWTCASSPPRTATCRRWWRRAPFAKTFGTAWRCSRSAFRRCANDATTSRNWRVTLRGGPA
jgi:transcriptional regulator with GAF, ATPase, and Fis domain